MKAPIKSLWARFLRLASLVTLTLPVACSWVPRQIDTPPLTQEAPVSVAAEPADWPTIEWWKKYGDTDLNALIAQAQDSAPSLLTAEARFASARESVRLAAAARGLQVAAQGSVTRQRLSDNGLISPRFVGFNWYSQADLGLQATYSFDIWHRLDAATRAAVNEARAAQAERSAAQLALAASVADAYFSWQADAAQLALVEQQVQLGEEYRDITAARVRAGIEANDNLDQAEVDLAALRESSTTLRYATQLRRVALAALLGIDEKQLPALTSRPLPKASAQLPASVRLDLLSRRADITADYWRVQAAEQQLRVARAEFYPDLSINALAGLSSIDLGKLLEAGSAAPSISAAIHLPIFDSGRLQAQYGARAAMLMATASTYNDTVISAAREVATQVTTLQKLDAQRVERRRQASANEALLRSATARIRQGITDKRPALRAEQALQQQRAALLNLDAAAVAADIQLALALGGGYVTEVDEPSSKPARTSVAPAGTPPAALPQIKASF